MTTTQITAAAKRETIKHEAAAKIRAVLEEARKAYGEAKWDDGEVENAVLELVTEEGEDE